MEEHRYSPTSSSAVNKIGAVGGSKSKVEGGNQQIVKTTEAWPSQSDEDIDRLVAMHQNRHNSISSLGVRKKSKNNYFYY